MQNNESLVNNCPVCRSSHQKKIGEKNTYQIVTCTYCNLVFVNPQPNFRKTKEIYDETYFVGGNEFGYQGINYLDPTNEQWFKYLPTQTLTEIEKLKPQKGKLLDIGCAVGYFLEVAKENSWEIYGVELSNFAAKIASKKLGINIPPTLEDANFHKNSFDVITAFEIIEHLHDPSNFIHTINQLLKDDGILSISTPNLDHSKTFKNILEWNYLTPPEHLFFFNKKTLTDLLKKNGYQIIKVTFGPINPLNKLSGKRIEGVRSIYQKLKPILKPIKKILYDYPMNIYGKYSGLGEDLIIIAQKKKTI